MPIATSCNHCGKAYKVSSKFAGKKAKCTDCGNSFSIPAPMAAPVPNAALYENDMMAGLSDAAAMEGDAPAAAGAQARVSTAVAQAKCPSCSQPMPAAAIICISCGYNRKTNQTMKVQVEKEKPAPEPKPAKVSKSYSGGGSKGAFSSLLIGGGACAYGIYEYIDLKAMEDEGGTRQVHTIIKAAYEAGGRGMVLGVLLGIGGLFLLLGFYRLTRN
jgi:DNA-directed RNA polymerase subunit M/transcription elongation factor TFIIS